MGTRREVPCYEEVIVETREDEIRKRSDRRGFTVPGSPEGEEVGMEKDTVYEDPLEYVDSRIPRDSRVPRGEFSP